MSCWFHGDDCPEIKAGKPVCCPSHGMKCVFRRDPSWTPDFCSEEAESVCLHRPNQYGTFAEEAHAKLYPERPWQGVVEDLNRPEVQKVWSRFVTRPDGTGGPVVNGRGEEQELNRRLCEVGIRRMDPGETLKHRTRAERARDIRMPESVRRELAQRLFGRR